MSIRDMKERSMWFLKLLLLFTIVLTAAPKKKIQLSHHDSLSKASKVIAYDFDSEEEEQEEEESEELAA
jgi:hypothetical protein